MKELSTEEKAKAYDNALERVKSKLHYPDKPCFVDVTEIFPELAEDDERIRKALIRFHKSTIDIDGIKGADVIAWLEKQGSQILANSAKTCKDEQKPADKVKPKFKIGDWVIVSTSDGEKVVQIDSIEYFKSGEPRYITSEGRWFGNGTKAHLLTDVEISTIAESKAIKSKSWSEEDEKILNQIQDHLREYRVDKKGYPYIFEPNSPEMVEYTWLKSLKDRHTWKPSERQKEALLWCVVHLGGADKQTLGELLEELNKL